MRFNYDWPIKPSFLSICKEIEEKCSEYSPNKHGLYHSSELYSFLVDIPDNAFALFQLVPNHLNILDNEQLTYSFTPKDAFINNIVLNRNLISIHPEKIFKYHKSISKKNCEDNVDKCFETDSLFALLYHSKLSTLHYDNQYDEFQQATLEVIEEYIIAKQNTSENVLLNVLLIETVSFRNKKRFFIKTQCRHCGLEKYFIPVVYSGRVIAVMMYQRKTKIFELGSIIERINFLEERIRDKINVITNRYVTKEFQAFDNEFRFQLKQIDEKAIDALEHFIKVLNNTLQRINSTFNSEGFIRIYSIKSKLESVGEIVEFDLIGNSSEGEDSSNYSKIILKGIKTVNNNIEKDELLKNYVKGLPTGFDRDKDILRLIMPFTSQMAYIVWKRYNKWKEDQEDQFNIYATTLKSMYHSLLEPYIILRGIKLEENLETSMRLTGHESAQIIPAVIYAINNKESLNTLEDGSQYHGPTFITKPAHAILDVSYRLKVLEGLFRRSTMVLKNDPPNYDWYDLHRIVYATESLFQQRANDNSRQRIILNFNNELHHYDLLTDYVYLSHILFNLVDNALKYGLRGSNIYINVDYKCDPFYEQFNKKVIQFITIAVKNYGDEIPLSVRENIFELYVRYYTGIKRIEGMGIGLFIAKKLCNLLGYTVKCTDSTLIDQYHLPAKFHYINQNEEYNKNIDFSPEVLSLLQMAISGANKESVINSDIDDWKIGKGELEYLIIQPTYCNEFIVTIPIYNNSKNNNLKIK